MDEEKLKQAFVKVKEDMLTLGNELSQIKLEVFEIKQLLQTLYEQINNQKLHEIVENQTSTHNPITSTHPETSTQTSTVPQEIGGLKDPNLSISTGNGGVSTDRQTDTSTDTSTHNLINLTKIPLEGQKINIETQKNIELNIQEASKILESLDNLKKEIRRKFKRITPREMAVFSAIYQLEEQNPTSSNYKQISIKLGLSESSIRDYVQRMINKGIPLKKQKINNKKLILSISPELKKIATLSTIIQLRDL